MQGTRQEAWDDPRGPAAYEWFKKKVLALTGIDLSSYKQRQMQRRINSLMDSLRVQSYQEYYRLLEQDRQRYEEFVRHITINVSEFFRNPERFEDLEKKIIPELLRRNKELRVWSAGAASGHEPYSLAIILLDLDPGGHHYLLATDIDRDCLARAQAAIYHLQELRNVSPERLKRYFVPVERGDYQVKAEVRKMVHFRYHNLLTDPFESDFDLILCRNVIIYFTEEAKDMLFRKFFSALRPGGVLLLGSTEPLLRYREYGYEAIGTTFYRKPYQMALNGGRI